MTIPLLVSSVELNGTQRRGAIPTKYGIPLCRGVTPTHPCKGKGGDTECPLQVCQLSRFSESTHVFSLRRDVSLFDSTRDPDGL